MDGLEDPRPRLRGGSGPRKSRGRPGIRARIAGPRKAMEKVLEGDLARFEVPDLLSLLKAGRRTGVLSLERRDQESKLYLRAGDPVFAVSTREELRLGRLLARQGRVPAEIVDEALAWHQANRGRLGPGPLPP